MPELPWRIATYNVLSLVKAGRAELISRSFADTQIVGLIGTGSRRDALPCDLVKRRLQKHFAIEFVPPCRL